MTSGNTHKMNNHKVQLLNPATELTCRFSPLARLRSILTVLCVSTLLLMLCIRKALTVTIGQLGGSNSNTYTQTELREAMKEHSISEIITVAPFPVHVDYTLVKAFCNFDDQCTGYVVHMYAYMRACRSMFTCAASKSAPCALSKARAGLINGS